jgi:LAS superfamily LD-carboxypeptidase LdcB
MRLIKFIILFIFISVFACNQAKIETVGVSLNQGKHFSNPNQELSRNRVSLKHGQEDYPDHLNIDFIMGKFDPSSHDRFVRIEDKYTNKTNIYLDKKAYKAFLRMYRDAYKEGFRLVIISATRNFEYQKRIWDNKWSNLSDTLSEKKKAMKILEFSSMPGSSRHHWGTEMDLNVLENRYYEEGDGKKIYDWLKTNAHKYGFCKPYTAGRDKGYNEEKWHWSYKPLSSIYLKYAKENMKDEFISGFKGAEFANELKITQNYILGVSEDCF